MKLPERLLINAIPWTVTVDDPLDPADEGATYTSRLEIRINDDVHEKKHEAIFWHELCHALINSLEVNVKKDINSEEDLCRFLGPALYSFFSANADIHWKETGNVEAET